MEILKNFSFIGGSINPCLYVKKSAKGIVYMALHIDDNLMIGNIATINDAITVLKNKGLVLKIMEELQDYLSCKIKISDDKKHAWLGQSNLIKNLGSKFGEVWSHKTPSTPKFLTMGPMKDIKKISMEDQQKYQLGIGMLLYLVKYLPPDLANTTRELSKANNIANPAAYKELLCVVKVVLDRKKLRLKIKPMGNLEIVCFSSSDYAAD